MPRVLAIEEVQVETAPPPGPWTLPKLCEGTLIGDRNEPLEALAIGPTHRPEKK
ncbi:hypothetical protein [Methanoculleus sp. 7T]|uniref:hypothetical protein n=1 Tax=Methanoculleus sp. 7T TaxID=2937282 RepID=UPI0020BFE303|nr:hypothetical protein [Methanoculleus sp. 7T]MCK8519746.1 hypothetical protein [Methanoculleus sp. 7T]